jgi:hypothetical protein
VANVLDIVKWTLICVVLGAIVVAVIGTAAGVGSMGTQGFDGIIQAQKANIWSPNYTSSWVQRLIALTFAGGDDISGDISGWSVMVSYMQLFAALWVSFIAYRLIRAVFS